MARATTTFGISSAASETLDRSLCSLCGKRDTTSTSTPVHRRIDLQAELFLFLGQLLVHVEDGVLEGLARIDALQDDPVPGVEDVPAGEVPAQNDRGLPEPAPLLHDRSDVVAGPGERLQGFQVG